MNDFRDCLTTDRGLAHTHTNVAVGCTGTVGRAADFMTPAFQRFQLEAAQDTFRGDARIAQLKDMMSKLLNRQSLILHF